MLSRCLFFALLMLYVVFSWNSTHSKTCFFLASPWVEMEAILFIFFSCIWYACMRKRMCPVQVDTRGGCWLSCPITLHFIPLRWGLLLNLELCWRPISSTNPIASSLHSAMCGHSWNFTRVLKMPTLVLKFAQKVLLLTRHLTSPCSAFSWCAMP